MREVSLGTICDIKNGYAFKSSDFVDQGIPLIRISSFDNGPVFFDKKTVYVSSHYLASKSSFKVEKGDVLIALSGATTGKFGVYTNDEPSLLNQRIGLLKSGVSKDLDDKYFYYYLSVLQSEILSKAGGAAQPNISTKAIGELKIPLPPLPQQKKIAAILDAADAYRQKTKALIAKYDELTQSLFLHMFGDPVTNPMGWELKYLSDVCTKITDGTHQGPKFIDTGVPFLLVSNIVNNQINFNVKKYISEDAFAVLTKSTAIEKGDLLYTSVGSYGNPAIVKDTRKFCFQRHIAQLKPKHNLINVVFLHAMMASSWVKRQADKYAIGVAQKTLNLKAIKAFRIYLPDMEIQNQFANRVQAIESQKAQATASLEKAEDLFNSLLQRAFKGELTDDT